MSVCQGCGAKLAPSKAPGPPRKWCSEQCRKTQYDVRDSCVDCGTSTSYGPRNGRVPEPRCLRCGAVARGAEHRALIEALWAEGLPQREIQERVGSKFNASSLRSLGWNLPHRNRVGPPERRLAALERARAAKVAS